MKKRLNQLFASVLVLALLLSLMPAQFSVSAATSELFFSEYIEGSSYNKAIEIYNGTGEAIDLSAYILELYSNGAAAPSQSLTLSTVAATLSDGDVLVLANPSADAAILAVADGTSSTVINFNGDDAVVLRNGTVVIDAIGQVGVDPGYYWGSGDVTTQNHTLRRMETVCSGDDNETDPFDPTLEWDGYPEDTFDGLGVHTADCDGVVDTAPFVLTTTPANAATNVAIDANVDVTFSEAVDASGSWFDVVCTSSGSHTAAVSGGPTTFTLDPDVALANSETCTVTVYAAQVTDQDTDDPPDNMDADFAFSFDTEGVIGDSPEIIITEIMYDPNSAEDNWEWIEIYNAGSSSVDLSGFVVDDNNSVAHSSANIASGTLAAGEQAVLYNVDDISAADFQAAWGTVNLIPVTHWSAMGLNNDGDKVSLWDSFASYSGDYVAHTNAFDTVDYAGFPDPVGKSIYLTDLFADNNVGTNWATSTDGGLTPLYTGYTSVTAGGNVGGEVGSPGVPSVSVEVAINEFSASTTGTDVEYVEIFGTANADFSAYTILEIEGDSASNMGVVDEVISLGTTDADGFYLVNLPANALENGTLSLLLVQNFSGTFGDDLDTDNDGVLDVIPWDAVINAVAVNVGGLGDMTYGIPALGPNYDGVSSYAPGGASRYPDGLDTDAASDWVRNDFDLAGIPGYTGSLGPGEAWNTPGVANQIYIAPPEACGDAYTPIYSIQGSGFASTLDGSEVATEGSVVGDFQVGGKSGYFIQDPAGDGDAATSDGIFVFSTSTDVNVGDHVRVRGYVDEYYDLTEITNVSQVWLCGTATVAPTLISLPVIDAGDFEAYEGMLVTYPQSLYISEYFEFGQYGEIVLSTTRQFQPTATYEPGSPEAAQALVDNLLSRIKIDDGRSWQNPDPALHPNGGIFDLTNLFRGGDVLNNLTGVMDYNYSEYKIQPTMGADYVSANPRTAQPDDVGGGLKVASFNVLNYFTTLGSRGADTALEFERQRAKIFAALAAINADVVGLIEIENNTAAIQDLVDGLNTVVGAGTYAYVDTDVIGTDEIKVAFIYKTTTVSLVGDYAILDSSVDSRFIDTANRPVLAQTFMDNANGGIFTAAVNHLKSKGSSCDDLGDPDLGDGAGNCNLTRTAAAEALVDWLATDPTSSGDADFLIIGDLNSYDKEDPIDAILAGGYSDLIYQYIGEDAYSYVFDGQLGYLDHALANSALGSEISGVTIWHINADEASLIDYDMTYKQDAQDAIYAPDAYRSSDHDPVVIGMNVCDEIAPTLEISLTPDNLWPANHKYVDVTATVIVTDNFDSNPTVTLLSVTSSEADEGLGDGDFSDDIVIIDDYTFQLRAERSATNKYGRVYTFTYQVVDACGNVTVESATVFVPFSQTRK